MSLNLDNLKNSRDEVLKAEIGSLLFNLGKTHIGIGNWKDYFSDDEESFFGAYKDYYQQNYFENELNNIDTQLKNFIIDTDISLNGETKKWVEYFKGNVSKSEIIQKIFFRGSENVNSGIDKGSPKKQIENKLWISNAFGSFKEEVNRDYFDNQRADFFENLHNFLDNNSFYDTPNWQEIRGFVLDELKKWYSHLLSDSRFPVNDVTLYDQAYMSATMFKASLAGILLNTTESQNYISNPQSIKWQVLGIQYDKLSLAEKGLKPAHIIWYREASKKVDKKIEEIVGVEYALGNEVYRDETGVYFLVPEDITIDDIEKLKQNILESFKDNFHDEVYPYFGLTKASRGTMNLTSLLENAKSNFLKADYSFKSELVIPEISKGICQICQNRLVENKKEDDEEQMCNICRDRSRGRVDTWLQKQEDETIWIDELADSNNRVALISLKFELMEWLNGGLLSSLLVRNENFDSFEECIKKILNLIQEQLKIDEVRKLDITNNDEIIIQTFLSLFDEGGIQEPYNKSLQALRENKSIESIELEFRYIGKRLLKEKEWLEDFKFYENDEIYNNRKKGKKQVIEQYDTNAGIKDHIFKIFIINFIRLQINNILLERSIGDKGEEFIKNNLSDNEAIDFENRKIFWNKLNENDFEFLSKLLLQFLLRKNPSPARLRRVWESTEDFFSDVQKNILGSFVDIRTKDNFRQKVPDFAYLDITDNQEYKQYFSIIDPTPISWQFIIPTQKVEGFIKEVQDLYHQHFKYVNGKLPLHIGVVVQKSKDPLYVGIKALRNIRRDIKDWSEIKKEGIGLLKNYTDETDNNPLDYYYLYETENFDYDFMLLPSGKGIKKYNETDVFTLYPNTIDFEFLDTNNRRNDIYYENGKRVVELKQNRPYSWKEFENFKNFKDKFSAKSNQLQVLVSLIYSKMEDWKDSEDSFKIFMESTFKQKDIDIGQLGMDNYGFDEIKKFLDMFEFWHTVLKMKEI